MLRRHASAATMPLCHVAGRCYAAAIFADIAAMPELLADSALPLSVLAAALRGGAMRYAAAMLLMI